MTEQTTRAQPVKLAPNRFDHFYRGGGRLAALRGQAGGSHQPEEWVASATTRAGEALLGLSRLPDGSLLRDRLGSDPRSWLGPEHLARYGADGLELLVKLLDAGQRLPVHVHPDRAFAGEHLGLAHGKTEAWIVVDADPGAVVGLGLRRPTDLATLTALVRAHDADALVDALHHRTVRPGDGILVPAGTPHFIGAGVFVVELQEPTDLSILLEWQGLALDGERDGHLGLGFDVALRAVDLTVWSEDALAAHIRPAAPGGPAGGTSGGPSGGRSGGHGLVPALPADAEPYFRAHRVTGTGPVRVEAGLSVLVVLDGAGELAPQDGAALPLRRGDAVLVPWAAGPWAVTGEVDALLCRPPAPDAPPVPR
jgi:mannose-6-phosphate isomerase